MLPSFLFSLLILLPLTLSSQSFTETKLTASDADTNDRFGYSVAASNDRLVVGARLDDDNGIDAGSAYVYDWDSTTSTWTETKLTASDAALQDEFGVSVAIAGLRIVVGARANDDNGLNSGSAYVYTWNSATSTWDETKIIASDGAATDLFANSVAISGDRVVVGAYFDDDKGANSGSAYVYTWDSTTSTWAETKLTASDGAAGDNYGFSVAISGDRIVVGAHQDDDNGNLSGSAYVYDWNSADSTWDETKLTASDGAADDLYGISVAISGDRLVVGAHQDDDNGGDAGSAYVYDWNSADSTWDESKLTASDAATDDWFGRSVSISGDRLVVGARFEEDNGIDAGSAYVYDWNSADSTWDETKLTASDSATEDQFGYSVTISSDRIVVGATFNDDNGSNSGSAYVFEECTPTSVIIDTTIPSGGTITLNGEVFDTLGTFSQTLTDTAGCDSLLTVNITAFVGLQELQELGLKTYPNPTSGTLTIEASETKPEALQLYDLTGALRNTWAWPSGATRQTLDLSNLPAGLYILHVQSAERTAYMRVLRR